EGGSAPSTILTAARRGLKEKFRGKIGHREFAGEPSSRMGNRGARLRIADCGLRLVPKLLFGNVCLAKLRFARLPAWGMKPSFGGGPFPNRSLGTRGRFVQSAICDSVTRLLTEEDPPCVAPVCCS